MAGFSKVYFVGSTGGFMGADGLARPFFQILQGESDRQWLEPLYGEEDIPPLGSVAASSRRVRAIRALSSTR